MGSLTLPATGSVYVDTPILIYSVEKHPQWGPLLRPLWQAAEDGTIEIISSQLVLVETLTIPLRTANESLIADYETLFESPGITLTPITPTILRDAARLRAAYIRLRTPDAIHAATASLLSCRMFLSNDHGFRNIANFNATILSDVLSS